MEQSAYMLGKSGIFLRSLRKYDAQTVKSTGKRHVVVSYYCWKHGAASKEGRRRTSWGERPF